MGFPEISVYPAVELMAVVQVLAGGERGFSYMFEHDTTYARAARKYFKPFAKEAVVSRYKKLAEKGLDYIHAAELALNLGPGLVPKSALMYHVRDAFGGERGCADFLEELRAFERKSDFKGFYRKQKPFIERIVKTLEKQARALRLKEKLEAYTGLPVETRLTVAVSPFATRVDAATLTAQGEITVLIGPLRARGGAPVFDLRLRSGDLWRRLAYEQLRPLVDPHARVIERSKELFNPVRDSCESWLECVRMHLSFAVGLRLLNEVRPETAEEWPIKYAKIGIPYIAPLAEALAGYERARKRYPDIGAFVPDWLKALEKIKPQKLLFRGTIGDMLAERGDSAIVVPAKDAAWLSRAQKLKAEYWPKADIATDAEALREGVKGKSVVVLGGVAENRFLRERFPDIPLKVLPDGIRLLRRRRPFTLFKEPVDWVSVAQNPDDKTQGMLIVASAAAARGLGLLPPKADLVVDSLGRRLKTGAYDKTRKWDVQ